MHQPVGPPFSDLLVRSLAAAETVAVLTGAGVSAESGVPTFRDPNGLWQQFRPEELANVDAFLRNPLLVQGWYGHRRAVVEDVAPNAGHVALAELEALVVERGGEFLLATQNVDGLHQRAGSERVVELHGSLLRSFCSECRRPASREELDGMGEGQPARCPDCDGLVRPDVVWFGEMLPEKAIRQAEAAALTADVFLSVGTSGAVFPAAGLPLAAKAVGAYVAEVNPRPSEIAHQLDERVGAPAGVALPALVEAVREAR